MSKYIHQGLKKKDLLWVFTNCGFGVKFGTEMRLLLYAIMSSRMASTNPLDPSIHGVASWVVQ
jgi:hypothetical protein